MRTQIISIPVNAFYNIAEEYRKYPTEESKIEVIDRTPLFWHVLCNTIRTGGIIIINVNAKMRGGKSTVAFYIGSKIQEELIRQGKTPPSQTFNTNNICRDQLEYVRKMTNPETKQTCIVIDEDDPLEMGGGNITSENQAKESFIEVQAARYVHTIWVKPKGLCNPHADILLDLLEPDRTTGTTRAKLSYRYTEQTIERTQLLGFVDFNVLDTIKYWKITEPYYYATQPKKPREEEYEDKNTYQKAIQYYEQAKHYYEYKQEIIEKYQKKDWYVDYQIRKHQKFDMITKEGIFRPRQLDYAKIVLQVINRNKKLAELTGKLDRELIKADIKTEYRNQKINLSLLNMQEETEEAKHVLDLIGKRSTYIKKLRMCKKLMPKLPNNQERLNKEIETYAEVITEISHKIDTNIAEYEKLARLKEEYDKKGGTTT